MPQRKTPANLTGVLSVRKHGMSLDQLHCNRENGNGTDERAHDGVDDLMVHDVSPSKGKTRLMATVYACFNAYTNAVFTFPICKNGMAPEKAMPPFIDAF